MDTRASCHSSITTVCQACQPYLSLPAHLLLPPTVVCHPCLPDPGTADTEYGYTVPSSDGFVDLGVNGTYAAVLGLIRKYKPVGAA